MGDQNKGPSFGEGLLEGLREALAWKRGEVVLEVIDIEHAPPSRICAVRNRHANFAADKEEL